MCGPGESPWPGPRGAQTGQKPFRKRSGGGGAARLAGRDQPEANATSAFCLYLSRGL